MLGKIIADDEDIPFYDPMSTDLVATVTPEKRSNIGIHKEGQPTVVLVDCGCKTSITRSLVKRGLNVVQVPYDDYFLNDDYDGLFISNGPGDPQMCSETVKNVQHALAVGKPILGICLGNQILSLAAGASTYKLKFGHRGQNQPCIEMTTDKDGNPVPGKKCVITSQNHGYAVKAENLNDDWQLWFVNANDNTVEGIKHKSKPYWCVQFHPEANPGPTDSEWIFDQFADAVKGEK
jgi:carbamoyl-phosphate synthase small subunit